MREVNKRIDPSKPKLAQEFAREIKNTEMDPITTNAGRVIFYSV